jgi:hypothetical protein
MILTNRLFERQAPNREAKNIYIFGEGAKREYQYFKNFREMDSRIKIEIYELRDDEDNSPAGLLSIAQKCILSTENNPKPKYSFQENDEVWLVFDTDKDKGDSRKAQIERIRAYCEETSHWFVAESNPCFEVWLYYHFKSEKPTFEGDEFCTNWKKLVNDSIVGGFDSRKHFIFIEKASKNAQKIYTLNEGILSTGNTEVFKLSKSILPLLETKIRRVLKNVVK